MKLIQAALALCMAAAISAAPYGPPATTIVTPNLEYASIVETTEVVTLNADASHPATTYTYTHFTPVGSKSTVLRTYTLDADGFYLYD
ncbi:hypothetical protein EMMF5_004324 [Cystobasidiomycetes sp. EMM_F5]